MLPLASEVPTVVPAAIDPLLTILIVTGIPETGLPFLSVNLTVGFCANITEEPLNPAYNTGLVIKLSATGVGEAATPI
jgi:hypothetical protein